MEVTIRSATQADAASVRGLVYQVLREFGFTPEPSGTDADLADLERSYRSRGGAFDLLLDGQGKLLGCVGLYPMDPATVELRKMYLRREARGHGLGRKLLEHAIGQARHLGFRVVVLQTASSLERAHALYLRAGFRSFEPDERVPRCDLALRLVLDQPIAGGGAVPAHQPHAELLTRFYSAFAARNHETMARCYAPTATFSDPVFVGLRGPEVAAMWRMLCLRATDLRVTFGDIRTEAHTGSARWEAWYTYTATGRPVHNQIAASFEFQDGLILHHVDRFSLTRWARQALGLKGLLLGWAPPVHGAIRAQARRALQRSMEREQSR